jgi:hypothetical protein
MRSQFGIEQVAKSLRILERAPWLCTDDRVKREKPRACTRGDSSRVELVIRTSLPQWTVCLDVIIVELPPADFAIGG